MVNVERETEQSHSPQKPCKKRLHSPSYDNSDTATCQTMLNELDNCNSPEGVIVHNTNNQSESSTMAPIVTNSFYGSTSKKYVDPLDRKKLAVEGILSPRRLQGSLLMREETANLSASKKSRKSSSPRLKSSVKQKHNNEKKENISVAKTKETADDSAGSVPSSPRRSPRKRKFFKHRDESPSKRKRSKVGIAIQLHKGVTMKFNPNNKAEKPKGEVIQLKPRPRTTSPSVKTNSASPNGNEFSQDLFPDFSQKVPSSVDSGCNMNEHSPPDDSQPESERVSQGSENWSNCSIASDSINLLADDSSPASTSTNSVNSGTSMKYFPIFDKCRQSQSRTPGSSRVSTPSSLNSSPCIKRSSKPLLKKMKGKDGKEQMILDFGQRLAGAVQCEMCGMTYTHGEPTDEATHSNFHQRLLNALKFKGWKKERVEQGYADGSRIIMVMPQDKVAAKKVAAIRAIVDEDLGFVVENVTSKPNSKTYLYISSDQRVVGCCVAEVISQGYRVVGGSNQPVSPRKRQQGAQPLCCATQSEPAKCGISRIWVLSGERRKGIASRLLDTVRCHFIMGYQLERHELAFTDPTPDGRVFAAKYTDTPCFLVYKHQQGVLDELS